MDGDVPDDFISFNTIREDNLGVEFSTLTGGRADCPAPTIKTLEESKGGQNLF